jgi:hypothetical protein
VRRVNIGGGAASALRLDGGQVHLEVYTTRENGDVVVTWQHRFTAAEWCHLVLRMSAEGQSASSTLPIGVATHSMLLAAIERIHNGRPA